jgi:hypothetical protein
MIFFDLCKFCLKINSPEKEYQTGTKFVGIKKYITFAPEYKDNTHEEIFDCNHNMYCAGTCTDFLYQRND